MLGICLHIVLPHCPYGNLGTSLTNSSSEWLSVFSFAFLTVWHFFGCRSLFSSWCVFFWLSVNLIINYTHGKGICFLMIAYPSLDYIRLLRKLPTINDFDKWTCSLVLCSVAHSCQTLCDSMDCSLPGSSVHRIFQARIVEWVEVFTQYFLWV